MTVSDSTSKVALVTGGAGGLGSAIARRFVEAGDIVYIVDADETAVLETAKRIAHDLNTETVIGIVGDVRDEVSNRGIIDRISHEHGRLNRLINAAGVGATTSFGTITREDWSRVLEINL